MISLSGLPEGVVSGRVDENRIRALETFSGKTFCRRCGGHLHEVGQPPVFRLECVLAVKVVSLGCELFYHRARRRAVRDLNGSQHDHKAFQRRQVGLKIQKEVFDLLLRIVRVVGHFVRPFVRVRKPSQTNLPAATQINSEIMEAEVTR